MRSERLVFCALALGLLAPAQLSAQTPSEAAPEATGEPVVVEEEATPEAVPVAATPTEDATDAAPTEADPTPTATPETITPEPLTTEVGERPEDNGAAALERAVAAELDRRDPPTIPVRVAWNQASEQGQSYPWSLTVGGYIRAGYVAIEDDASGTFGQHDGFVLGNARLSLDGRMRSLGFKFQIDGAVDQTSGANDPNAMVVTRLRDANLYWEPVRFLRLTAGQFKPPFDVEEQFSTSQLLFVNRSVGSRGVSNIEGRNIEGLSVDRQVGLMLGARPFFFMADDDEQEGPGISYGVALTNGQDSNRALNDNDKLAGYGRAALHWGDMVSVGGGYSINPRTIGVAPDTIGEDVTAWTGDLVVDAYGLSLVGSLMNQTVKRPELDGVEPETTGFAYQAQLAYREPFLGLQPAIRYAYFDPAERADVTDELTYITFGLNYLPPYPVRLLLNYTITQESETLALANNRFDAVLQVTW